MCILSMPQHVHPVSAEMPQSAPAVRFLPDPADVVVHLAENGVAAIARYQKQNGVAPVYVQEHARVIPGVGFVRQKHHNATHHFEFSK